MAKKTNKKTTCTIKLAENTMDAQFVNLLQEFKQDVKTVLGKIFSTDEMQTIMERLDQVQQIKFDKSGLVANGLGLWDPATNSITISSSLNNPTDKDIAKRLKFTLYHELVHAISEHEPALTANPTEQENELATQASTTANPATNKYRPGELFDEIKTEYLANELFKQNKKGMRLQTIYDFFKSPHEQLQLSVEHAGTAYQEYGQQGDIYHLFFGDQLLRAHFFTSDEQKFINDFNTMFADTVITYTEFENQEDPLTRYFTTIKMLPAVLTKNFGKNYQAQCSNKQKAFMEQFYNYLPYHKNHNQTANTYYQRTHTLSGVPPKIWGNTVPQTTIEKSC